MKEFQTKLYELIKNLSKAEQEQLLKRLSAINLATDINREPEFLSEAIEELGKDYPILKDFIENEANKRI